MMILPKKIFLLASCIFCVERELCIYEKDGSQKIGMIFVNIDNDDALITIHDRKHDKMFMHVGHASNVNEHIKFKNDSKICTFHEALQFMSSLAQKSANDEKSVTKTAIKGKVIKTIVDFAQNDEEPYNTDKHGKRKSIISKNLGWGSWRSDNASIHLTNSDAYKKQNKGKIYNSIGDEVQMLGSFHDYWTFEFEENGEQKKAYLMKAIDEENKVNKFCLTIRDKAKQADKIEGVDPYIGTSKSFHSFGELLCASCIPDSIFPFVCMCYFTSDAEILKQCPGNLRINSINIEDGKLRAAFTTSDKTTGNRTLTLKMEIDDQKSYLLKLMYNKEGNVVFEFATKTIIQGSDIINISESNELSARSDSQTIRKKIEFLIEKMSNNIDVTKELLLEKTDFIKIVILFILKIEIPLIAEEYPDIITDMDGKSCMIDEMSMQGKTTTDNKRVRFFGNKSPTSSYLTGSFPVRVVTSSIFPPASGNLCAAASTSPTRPSPSSAVIPASSPSLVPAPDPSLNPAIVVALTPSVARTASFSGPTFRCICRNISKILCTIIIIGFISFLALIIPLLLIIGSKSKHGE